MRINNNIMALNTHRQLSINNTNTAKSLEKLSSGYRINRAGDDAAGLAISEKMRAQIRGLTMASKNAQDGISLIQTAEGALTEVHEILQRMRELADQSANDTNVEVDRSEIQKEIDQLASEITRIANNTEFNTQKLLNGGIVDIKFHIGANAKQNISLSIGAMDAYSLGIARDGIEASLAAGASNISDVKLGDSLGPGIVNEASINVSAEAIAAVDPQQGTVTINGLTITTENNTDAYNDYQITIEDGETEGIAIDHNNKKIVITADISKDPKTDFSTITATVTGTTPTGAGGLTFSGTPNATQASPQTMQDNGTAGTAGSEAGIKITLNYGSNSQEITVAANAKSVNVTDGLFKGLSFTSDDLVNASGTINITLVEASAADFTDPDNVVEAKAPKGIDVSTQAAADAAITEINKAIEAVSTERSKLGAMQNRLEHTIKNLDTSAENLQAAESRIRDVDMAQEMMEFTKQNILMQAATAMLAQANMAPQTVLKLLG
jgi:flagellin